MRSKVKVHALCVMSNHYHAVVTDKESKLPLFTETFNKLMAKALNCLQERKENFWAGSSQVDHLVIGDKPAMLKQLSYVACNPVEAGLIKNSADWPGINLWTPGKREALRPDFYFRNKKQGGALPDSATLTISTPDRVLECPSQHETLTLMTSYISEQESALVKERTRSGEGFLGAAACKVVSLFDSPDTPPKVSPEEGGNLNPRVSCGDKKLKEKLLKLIDDFVDAHRECLKSIKAGVKNIVFPAGTYRMKTCFEHKVAEGGLADAVLALSSG